MQGQFKSKFRMSVVALGVMAALGSGQAMAVQSAGEGDSVTFYNDGNGNLYGTINASSADALNTDGTTATAVGNTVGTTTITGASVSINGVSAAYINNAGTGALDTTTTADTFIGSKNAASATAVYGGDSTLSIANGTASLKSAGGTATNGTTGTGAITGGGGYTSYTAVQTVAPGASIGSIDGTGGILSGAEYVNKINGNTLVDGNLYINGTLNYVSSDSATTTVVSGTTTGGMSVVNAGQTGVGVNANGKLTTGVTTTQATAALTVTNSQGNTHGIVVQEDKTTISGGTHSSSLTMADNGATFSDAATGAPVQVHGVNDGTSDFDAVNVRQFASAIASVTAMANIPQVDQDKTVSMGMALGNFMGKTALAAGVTYRFTKNGVLKGSVSSAMNASNSTAVGVGAAWSY